MPRGPDWGMLTDQTDEDKDVRHECNMELLIEQAMQDDKAARLKALKKATKQEHQRQLEQQESNLKRAIEEHRLAREEAA